MTDHTTPPPGDRGDQEAVARVIFHDDYELSILIEPDGRLRQVIHAVGVDGTELFARSDATVVDNARHGDGGEQRAAEWAERLERLQTTMQPISYRTTPPGAAPGQPETVECFATPIPNADGTLNSILLQAYDRTTTDWVLAQLRESQTMFSLMADSLPQMIWIADGSGQVTYFSPQWAAFTGRTIEELLGHGFLDLVHPDDVELIQAGRGSTNEFTVMIFRLRRHDGAYRWVEADYRTLFDDDHAPVRWVGATSDVTDRLDDEAAARELQEQLRVALSVTRMGRYALYFGPIGVGRITGDSRFSEILGVDVPEMMQRGGLPELFAMIHKDDVQYVEHSVEAAASGGPDYDVEYRMWRPTSYDSGATELRWIGARGRVEFAEDGSPVRMLGVVEDITERRAEQEARLRWQKHEAIGSLAGGVAHDFNNVISAILSNASLAETELRLGVSPETSVREIARGAERAAGIVRQLLAFSREDDEAAEPTGPFDLGEVVKEACGLVGPGLPGETTLRWSADPDLPSVSGNASDLHRVLLNLLTNAAHSVAGRDGVIEVSVDVVDQPADPTANGAGSGSSVRVRVQDDGPGIPSAIVERIFDPFFTTKPTGQGTGLGLAAAQSIVREHGGTIAVSTPESGGACFTILLPPVADGNGRTTPEASAGPADRLAPSASTSVASTAEPGAATDAGSTATASPGAAASGDDASAPAETDRRVHILFVDDEAPLTRLAERAMPALGFAVSTFTDPEAALAAAKLDPARFDALVTDLSMPGMTGLELVSELRELRPDLPVVLSSGFLTPANRQTAIREGVNAIVPKPCSLGELADALDRVLDGKG